MQERVNPEVLKEAKRLAEEDYSLIANMISGASSKKKYIESRIDYYVKKLSRRKAYAKA